MSKLEQCLSAIRKGKVNQVIDLVNSGLEVNALDKDGRSLLINSIVSNNFKEEIIVFLINSGADPDLPDKVAKWTSLHAASQEYSAISLKHLIPKSKNIDARDAYGNTPLFKAVFAYRGESGEPIELLLKGGANPDAENEYGVSPRSLAEQIANYDVKKFFSM